MNLDEAIAPAKSSAAGQYHGYSLQQTRLCHYLLRAKDEDDVSFEYLDDVALHRVDGSFVLEQSKSALSGNPTTDRAEDLWKAFANWAELCSEHPGDLLHPPIVDFRYYVAPVKTGKLIKVLHDADSGAAASAALIAVKSLLDPKSPETGCDPYIKRFLSAGDDICIGIITHFKFETEADPLEAIRDRLRASIPSDTLELFCKVVVGMARDEIDRLIREKKPPIIGALGFRKKFQAFVRKYDLFPLLISKTKRPPTVEVSALVDTSPLFVRQLQAIDAKPDMLVTAVSDFLRTAADKIHWADEGVVVRNSFDELDEQLERQFVVVRDEIEDTHSSNSEQQRGRAVYRRCTATEFPLEGRSLPSHFIAGAFNCLADLRRLGWHPQYLTLFEEE